MDFNIENFILIGSILLLVSIIAGTRAYRFGVPALILFLVVGMLAGSEGIGQIHFDNPDWAQSVGVVALCFILFSGGLDTDWRSVRPVLGQGVALSTLGVLVTAAATGWFVYWITDFTLFEGLLLGAIVSSTDAAAVFSILRSKRLLLKHNLKPMLEFESGSNDPMAYLLTLLFLGLVLQPEASIGGAIGNFFIQIVVGGLAGLGFGWLMTWIMNHVKLAYMGLYSVMVIALMFIAYAATQKIGGNGFLAVYLSALWVGNHKLNHRGAILSFFDGFAWLMQIILFLTLGLLVYPSDIIPVIGIGLLISAFMIVVARPVSVFLALLPFRVPVRPKAMISWVGLRGAVPIVFATYPLIAGIDKAGMIFNIVFFISLTSIILQGTTIPLLAKWLGVSEKEDPSMNRKPELNPDDISNLVEIRVAEGNRYAGSRVADIPFPEGSRITLLKRSGNHLIVTGATVLKPGDRVIVAGDTPEGVDSVHLLLTTVEVE